MSIEDPRGAGPPFRLLRSKLSPPPVRRGIAPRPQLLDRLREGRAGLLTLVCAPAGYGKTTVLAQWGEADEDRMPFAWLSADEGDADPVRFWSYVIAGLRTVHPRAGAASGEALRSGARGLGDSVVPMLIEELSDIPPSVLVVDDWHRIRSRMCDETMRLFVEERPAALQVVLSSRSEPTLPVARWRAHGALTEVRTADLQMSHVEAAALLRGADLDLGHGDIVRLTERTEGWAAGLGIASILLRREEDPHAFVEDFAGDTRQVVEYISDDVLAAVGDDIRGFLVRVSVLDGVSGAACDALLGIRGSAAILTEIERRNLFLVPVDRHGEVYRFHRLFADALRREFARTDPAELLRVHRRASAWCERQGDIESAVGHAIAGRDVARASDLITLHWAHLVNVGRLETLCGWLGELSWPEAAAEPQLAVVRASLAAQTARPADEIERWLEVAASRPRPGRLVNGLASIASAIAVIRALYLTRGVAAAVDAAERAVSLEGPGSPWRRQALLGLGQARYLQGDPAGALVPLEEAQRLPFVREHVPAAAAVLAYRALAEAETGRSVLAGRHARESVDLLEAHGLARAFVATNSHIALAMTAGAEAGLDGQARHLEAAARLSAPSRPNVWHVHALLRLAAVRHGLGEGAVAREAVEAARADLEALPDAGMLTRLAEATAAALHAPSRREAHPGEPLSDAEVRVLRLLAGGRSVSEVARALYLAPTTVKTHRRNIYRKLGVASRQEATVRVAELGLA